MNPLLKQFVTSLRTAYDQMGKEHSKLAWAMLTGLNGPGERPEAERIKRATAGIIRWVVFGKAYLADAIVTREDTFEYVFVRQQLDPKDHFTHHAKEAFKALGLEWDKINDLNREAREKEQCGKN